MTVQDRCNFFFPSGNEGAAGITGWNRLPGVHSRHLRNTSRDYGVDPGKIGFVKILTIFFSTLLMATARNASTPAAVASLWSDNSREGNTKPSQSAEAVRGDRHCPLR